MSRPERSDPGRGGPRSGERPARIAHYRIVERIGRGGMGVVYRAIDEKLGRKVALKLLSRRFEASPEMQARFIREARAASALTHPGIVTVHDVDAHEGRLYIVMEWIDGDSLGELARAGLPIAEALRLCAEAADALGAAHETGVLHRDIKCENLMATRDRRRLKVLDFGLAKLRAGTLDEAMRDPVTSRPPRAPDAPPERDDDEDDDLTGSAAPGPTLERPRPGRPPADDHGAAAPPPHAARGPLDSDDSLPPLTRTEVGTSLAPLEPTRPAAPRGQRAGRALALDHTTPAHAQSGATGDEALRRRSVTSSELTAAGAIMGTPAYMAPEQTIGGAPDVRSEVFSLGVVLYELLVGRRPFAGDTPEATMRAVHDGRFEPPSRAAPARGIPPVVDAVVMTALAVDPAARFPDMPAMARALRAALDALAPPPARPLRPYLPVAHALALLAVLGGALVLVRPGDEVHAHAATTRRISFEPGCEEYPSFSPDGRSLVFDGVVDSDYELFSLDLESGARRRLTRASAWDFGGAVSPDGGRVAYVHLGDGGRELRVLPVGPGASPEVAPLALGQISGFASWGADGTLVSARPDGRIVHLQLDARAGAPPRETTAAALPPGNVVRFVSRFTDGTLAALWLPSVEATRMTLGLIDPGAAPRVLDDQLPYDATSIVVAPGERAFYTARSHGGANELLRQPRGSGPPAVVPGGVSPSSGFSISRDGRRLAYSTCRESVHLARLRPGAPPQPISGSGPWRDRYPVVAGDHRVLFTSDRSGGWQIWSLDLRTRESVPLGAADTSYAAVSPDGATLGYCDHGGVRVRPLQGGPARALTDDGHDTLPSFTHDGRALVFERTDEAGSRTFVVPLEGGAPRPLTPPGARFGVASPAEDRVVFLLPEPGSGLMRLMSTTGAGAPPVPLSPSLPAADLSAPAFTADGRSVLVVRRSTEVLEVPVGGGPEVVRFRAGLEGIEAVRPAPDGDGLLAAVVLWEGDLWLAEGDFR